MTPMPISSNEPSFDARILIVEDERLIAEELHDRLTSLGATVVGSVVSGAQAVSQADALRPDLVLMDIRLKGEMDGIAAATAIRQSVGTPVVFLTAHSDHMTVDRAKDAGPYGYLLKPVQEHELRIALSLALHRCGVERELRVAEARLRDAQKLEAVGRLAGGVAHDVNNMMTVVSGYAELLLTQLPSSDPNRGLVEELRAAGDRVAGVTRQLLSFSRHRIARPRVAAVDDLLDAAGPLLAQVLPKHVSLQRSSCARQAKLLIDPAQFEQILLNLVLNARDAMPRGGTVTIEASVATAAAGWRTDDDREMPAGEYVLVAVSDTGAGVAPELTDRIFEPFFSTKADGHGAGLGLSVVRDMVRAAGGQVLLRTTAGCGSSFTLCFPRLTDDPDALPDLLGDDDSDLRAAQPSVVLLAEDEDAVRALTTTLLEQQGYTVLTACDGEDALQVAARHSGVIDLLLTDVVMPRVGGRELAERLAAARPGVRTVFMSGYAPDAVLQQGIMRDGLPFVQKPFKGRHLLAAVRDALRAPLLRS
ncbi:MAG TPA: response regulator [Luteitalea sp.]|nr:response regulator [Luteitalea sp.]